MRLLKLLAFFVFSAAVSAQSPQATPPPQPRSSPATVPQTVPATVRPNQPGQTRRFESTFPLNPVSESDRLSARITYLQRVVAPLYRKPSDKELEAIAPSPQVRAKFGEFLKLPNTGIFRLLPDAGCAPNAKVVNAREDCLKYSMPGAGNSYSFRTENYRIRHLADITYENGELQITGVFMHGMLAKLGDVPLETVSLQSRGIKFVTDFRPSTDAAEVEVIDATFRKGIEVGGYRYAMNSPVEAATTYAFRGVAYRGKVVRSSNGVRYNELDFDKREDVVVAFRVVDIAEDNSITILWHQLAGRETPRIKVPNKDENDDSTSAGN